MTRPQATHPVAAVMLLLALAGCSGSPSPVALGEGGGQEPGLKDRYRDFFLVGSVIQDADMDHPSRVVQRHCSMVTVIHFYWMTVQPEPGAYDFEPGDRRVAYAREMGIPVRGHPLLFGTMDPAWVFQEGGKPLSREKLVQRMQDHIRTVVSRYRGKIRCWDVVNEPTADIFFSLGAEPSPITDVYKRHGWYDIIGPEYVELALRFAHDADPDALLYVNENNIVGPLADLSRKKEHFFTIIEHLLERGAPLHGVGIQGHWTHDYPPGDDLGYVVRRLSELGLDVQITEMDLSTYSILRWALPELIPVHETFTPSMSQTQAERYRTFFRIFRECSPRISAVVFWGLSDPTSWLNTHPDERPDWPLLFDEHYEPKEALRAVMEF